MILLVVCTPHRDALLPPRKGREATASGLRGLICPAKQRVLSVRLGAAEATPASSSNASQSFRSVSSLMIAVNVWERFAREAWPNLDRAIAAVTRVLLRHWLTFFSRSSDF